MPASPPPTLYGNPYERIAVSSVIAPSPTSSDKPLLVVTITCPDDVELSVAVNGVGIFLSADGEDEE